jgi:hypothetical protein
VIEPRPFRLGDDWLSGDPERYLVGYSAVDPATGGLRYLLVQSARQGGSAIDLRPVFFDEEANRQVPRNIGRCASGGECITGQYALDPARQLTPEKVAYFGVERVVPDADRLLVEAAQREAKEKGMAILPPPRVGEPYPFDLPAIDGKRLRSGELRGKVVLVAVGGPGGSTVAQLRWIKRVREANPTDEIAIVGVSFDGSAEDARTTFADSGAEDRLVVVPNDPKARRIWREGAEIAHIPTFFLIDREGVLRFTCRSFELQDRIDILFGRARRGHLPKPTRIARPALRAPTVPANAPARGRGASPTLRPGA